MLWRCGFPNLSLLLTKADVHKNTQARFWLHISYVDTITSNEDNKNNLYNYLDTATLASLSQKSALQL